MASGGHDREKEAPAFAIDGMTVAARPVAPGLHVVATPIGNLGDMTLRGLATLAAADLIACEDTRVTRVLLDRYAISRPLIPYHEHNAAIQRPRILAELAAGKAVALVSDAGTPLISDPGYRLAAEAIEAGFAVIPVPGASAMLAALVASGLPTDAFYFAGFLPQKQGPRRKRLAALATVPGSLVVYESPKRLAACLADMAEVLGGDRPAAVARELTKTFETVRRGTLAGLAGGFAAEATPKGEIVVVVGPPGEAAAPDAAAIDELLAGLLATESLRSAADEAAALTGLPRRDLYQRALALKNRADDGDG
ncbi:MAG: 16S rRNA (cytidine(1402)-2'-O)-methyltransferase [Bauldia sp.]|nr:16S rRNA (cytidine(1402)-2'-O)-methyltransferase [Bauldia sp.]